MILRTQFGGSRSALLRLHCQRTPTLTRCWHASSAHLAAAYQALPTTIEQRGQTLRQVTRRLLLKCHPDYFVSAPKRFRRNSRSLQELLGLLDAAFPVHYDGYERMVAPCGLRTEVIFDLHGRQPLDPPVTVVFDIPPACEPEALADIVQEGVLKLVHQAGVSLKPKELWVFAALTTSHSPDALDDAPFSDFHGGGAGAEVSMRSQRRAEVEQMLRNHEYNNTQVAESDEFEDVVSRLFFAPGFAASDEQQAALKHLALQLPLLRRTELWRDLPLIVGVENFSGPLQDNGGWLSQGFLAIPGVGWTAADFLAYVVVAAPVARRASRRRRDYGD